MRRKGFRGDTDAIASIGMAVIAVFFLVVMAIILANGIFGSIPEFLSKYAYTGMKHVICDKLITMWEGCFPW